MMISAPSIRRRAIQATHGRQCASRLGRAKAEPRSEATGETAAAACGYCGTEWVASVAAPLCPSCSLTACGADGERQPGATGGAR